MIILELAKYGHDFTWHERVSRCKRCGVVCGPKAAVPCGRWKQLTFADWFHMRADRLTVAFR